MALTTPAPEPLHNHNSNTIHRVRAAVVAEAARVEAAREGDSNSVSSTAIAITVTMDDAVAISGDAADSAAAVVVEADSRDRAENRLSAHHWRRSFRMVRPSAGSIRSAKAASFAGPQIATWPSRVTRTYRRR